LFLATIGWAGFIPAFELPGQPVGGGASAGSTYTDPTTGMEFVFVKGGCFQMGSNYDGANKKQVHEVCLDDYYIAFLNQSPKDGIAHDN
jgi:formylglycine-generating enzyme required for sulfatase activity